MNMFRPPVNRLRKLICCCKVTVRPVCLQALQRCPAIQVIHCPLGCRMVGGQFLQGQLCLINLRYFSATNARHRDVNAVSGLLTGRDEAIDVAKNVQSLKELCVLVEAHGNNLDEQQITEFTQLYRQLCASTGSHLGLDDFQPFFDIVMRRAKFMDDRQLTRSLFHLTKSGVPQDTALIQTLLRQAENRINDMDVYELSILSCALDNLRTTEQVAAMLQAIALLSKNFLEETTSTSVLSSLLLSIHSRLSEKMIESFEDRIAAILHARKEPSLSRIAYIFNSFAVIGRNSDYVLDVASHFAVNSPDLDPDSWSQILNACEKLEYCNLNLLEHTVQIISNNIQDWSYADIARAFKAYAAVKFLNKPLLERVANRVVWLHHNDQSQLEDGINHLMTCAGLLAPYAELNFHPFPERYFYECLEKRALALLQSADSPRRCGHAVDLLHYCILMGNFPTELMQLVFSPRCEELLLKIRDKKLKKKRRNTLQSILRAVQISCDSDTKSKLHLDRPSKLLKTWERQPHDGKLDSKKIMQLSLKNCLQSLVDPGVHDIELDVGVFPNLVVDCRVVEKTSPVTDTNSDSSPSKSHALLLAPDSFYVTNLLEEDGEMWLLGNHVAKETQLKRLGYNVVWIPLREWVELKSMEKRLEYLSKRLGFIRNE
ncbi:FAST kinase domain-containing protein 2, mitochondrial-like [Ptychodera flava]|uniref:FAST kinase domain-containing protein 2, mitochondrial-like n=1 Tax=Ptychodera flava TaxID=63121 RepID=UPI003969D900